MLIYPNDRWFEHFYSAPVPPYSPSAFSFLAYLKVISTEIPQCNNLFFFNNWEESVVDEI